MVKVTLREAIRAQVADLGRVTCSEVAEGVAGVMGFAPSLSSVSRQLAELGWTKQRIFAGGGHRLVFDAPAAQAGRCRICGCTEDRACVDKLLQPCGWADQTQTLCDSEPCITAAAKIAGVAARERIAANG